MKFLKILFIFFLLNISSCVESSGPQEPIWGKETCAVCRMALTEKRFAVQRLLKNGEIHFYDDLKCAFAHNHKKDDEQSMHVRSPTGDSWVKAEDIHYEDGLQSPMGGGIAPTSTGKMTLENVKNKFRN